LLLGEASRLEISSLSLHVALPICKESWSAVFADELVRLADQNEKIVGITAAMLRPTGLHRLAAKHPDRVFDVGIAEQHAVTSARSEEHTSELQSRENLVCRLLLEK